MGLRDALQDKPIVGIVTAVIVIIAAVFIFMRSGGGGTIPAGSRFYYDLSTGDVVAFVSYDRSPVTLASGHDGVSAHIYACGDCQADENFVAYLEMFTEAYKRQLDVDANADDPNGLLVALKPESSTDKPIWVSIRSAQGQKITQAAHERCGSAAAKECYPHK